MTTNIALNEMLASTVAKIKTLAETGAPLTLQLASVIRAEARTSRAIELGSDAPLSVGDCLTMEAFLAMPQPVASTGGVGVQSATSTGGVGVQSARIWEVRGTRAGKPVTVHVEAADHNEAVRKGSHAPHMLVVRDVVLQDHGFAGAPVVSDVRVEFGDYGEPLPAIPFMYDASWKNDACPVLRDITGNIELWCDYADPAKREFVETARYCLKVEGEQAICGETLDHAILGALREALIKSMMATWNYARESASYALDCKGFTTEFRA